jgi:hypothetical protein
VRSDQTCHTGANYSHLLLCFALCERHLDDALQIPMKSGLQKSGRSSDCCGACKALHSKIKRNSLMAELYEINRTGETKDCRCWLLPSREPNRIHPGLHHVTIVSNQPRHVCEMFVPACDHAIDHFRNRNRKKVRVQSRAQGQ